MKSCFHLSINSKIPEKVFLIHKKTKKANMCSKCVVCRNKRDNLVCLCCCKVYCSKHSLSHGNRMHHKIFYNILVGCAICIECSISIRFVFKRNKRHRISQDQEYDNSATDLSAYSRSLCDGSKSAPKEQSLKFSRSEERADEIYPTDKSSMEKSDLISKGSKTYLKHSPYISNLDQSCETLDNQNELGLTHLYDKIEEVHVPMKYVILDPNDVTIYSDVFLKGIQNFGNTCYVNSVLQILLNTCSFRNGFLNLKHNLADCRNKGCILCSLKALFANLISNQHIIPDKFLISLMNFNREYCSSDQHDVHNLFIDILSCIYDVNKDMCSIFYGKMCSIVKCDNCGNERSCEEVFTSISLDFLKTLQLSLNSYFDIEKISDKVRCDCCNDEQTSTKKVEILHYPEILCLHIKRFRFDYKAVKINGKIDVPRIIRFPDNSYKLYGFIVHSGDINRGHYIAYIRVKKGWYMFNDHNVCIVDTNDVPFGLAYMLFYELRRK